MQIQTVFFSKIVIELYANKDKNIHRYTARRGKERDRVREEERQRKERNIKRRERDTQ